jgi:Rieske Fe-S protein
MSLDEDQSGSGHHDHPQWVKDFPINVGQDNYVARRDFTKFMILTSFAFVVGQFWIGLKSIFGSASGKLTPLSIAKLNDLPLGSATSFKYPTENDPCLLLRTRDGQLLAYSQKCTHLSCAVVPRLDEKQLFCPCHEGRFDLATGRPIAGPPRRPLPRINIEVRDGIIYATGVEVSTL